MKRFLRRFVFISCLTTVLSGVGLYLLYEHRMNAAQSVTYTFEVRPGASIDEISRDLKASGHILSSSFFTMVARVAQFDRSLKAGTFRLEPNQRVIDILNVLTRLPPVKERKITFPEGLNKWQIADRMSQRGWSRARVLSLIDREKLEGKLFPDTYVFIEDSSEADLLRRMHNRFRTVWAELNAKHANATKLSDIELLTLASMVEKEMVQSSEAPIIARVFLNRLEKGMKLQSDPTYVYSETRYGQKPTRSDRLKKGNPYNTDQIDGLPPGPIANAGRIALLAALQPASSKSARKLLYFVAKRDGTGKHHFSESYSEHRKAIKRYLKKN